MGDGAGGSGSPLSPAPAPTYDVYISKRPRERLFEELMVTDGLLAAGLRVWSGSVGGDVSLEGMQRGIINSRLFLHFLSPGSAASQFIRFEFQKALESGIPIMCLVSEDFDERAWVASGVAGIEVPEKPQFEVYPLSGEQMRRVLAGERVLLRCEAGVEVAVARVLAAVAAAPVAAGALFQGTHLLRERRPHERVQLRLLCGPCEAPCALFLKQALERRCPDLRVELLGASAPDATQKVRWTVAVVGASLFKAGCEAARDAFAAAVGAKKKQLTVFVPSGDAASVSKLGEGELRGWSAKVVCRLTNFEDIKARGGVIEELLASVGAVTAWAYPKMGVTVAGMERVIGQLLPEGCELLAGSEVYTRLSLALDARYGTVDRNVPFLEIPGLFYPHELGESTCLATYLFYDTFSRSLNVLKEAPPAAFVFLDPLCLPKYSSIRGKDPHGIVWRSHLKRHRTVLVPLIWTFDPSSAFVESWTLRRTWKLAEIAIASAEGNNVVFCSGSARAGVNVLEMLETDFNAIWRLCSGWTFSGSMADRADRERSVFPALEAVLRDALPGAAKPGALDRIVKDRVLGEVHAHLCELCEAEVQKFEHLGSQMATRQLPLAYARLLLKDVACGRFGRPRDAAAAAARAKRLCQAVLKARVAAFCAAPAPEAASGALFAAVSLAAAGEVPAGSPWDRVVQLLPPEVVRSFGAFPEPSAALFSAGAQGPPQKRQRATEGHHFSTASTATPADLPPSSLPPSAASFRAANDLALRSLEGDLRAGNVVLFLGAGFFGPTKRLPAPLALPDWRTLMEELVDGCAVSKDVKRGLRESLAKGGASRYEMVAQQLEDAMGRDSYEGVLRRRLNYDPNTHGRVMKRTFALLALLPFRTMLTTNFTRAFSGVDASMVADDKGIPQAALADFFAPRRCWRVEKSLASQVRASHASSVGLGQPGLTDQVVEARREEKLLLCAFDTAADPRKPLPAVDPRFNAKMLHIHGTSRAVSSRRSYRDLLYSNSSVLQFLRTLSATSKFLFIGYSLSDGYICEILQEVLALLAPPADAGERAPTELGYFFHFANGATVFDEALRARVEYRFKYQGLRTIFTTDPAVELQALQGASQEVCFARAFHGKRLLSLSPVQSGVGASFFRRTALAVAGLAFAAVDVGAAAGGGDEFARAELAFRRQRNAFDGLRAALRSVDLPEPAARPPLRLPLPHGGEFVICFSVEQMARALSEGGAWHVFICDWGMEKTLAGAGGVLREVLIPAAPTPALAIVGEEAGAASSCGGGGGAGALPVPRGACYAEEEWEARSRGYQALCVGVEQLLAALSELLQRRDAGV